MNMALAMCHRKLMTACLCRRLSRSSCLLSLSSHSDVVATQLVKCTVLARSSPGNVSTRANPQERCYSTQRRPEYYSRHSVMRGKREPRQCANSSLKRVNAGVACSTSSWTVADDGGSSPQSQNAQCRLTSDSANRETLPPAESIEELRDKYKRLRKTKKYRFVLRPELAKLMVDKVWPKGDLDKEKAFLIESNPGPGILTRHLLNSGAPRVLSLEREKFFLPSLSALVPLAEGRLGVMHADFFAMHYHGTKDVRPPIVRIATVFEGTDPVPWEDDIAVKVIGSLPHNNERTHAYIIASQLLERLSSFKYGRVQFNVFMSEGCYNVISQPTGNMMHYRALSALMQLSCDIELLHKEPQISFRLPTASGEASRANFSDKDVSLCLVRLTPKRHLFKDHQLSQQQAFIFVYFVRQLLAKRRQQLFRMIEAWAPGHGDIIQDFGYDEETLTGNVQPTDLLRIYMAICQVESFNGTWMGEEVVGYASRALELDNDPVEGYSSIAN